MRRFRRPRSFRTPRNAADRLALVSSTERITYGALWHSALRYAAVLRERGAGPGDRIGLLVHNSPHFPVAYFAVLALGATAVPVNVLLKSDDIAYILRHAKARLLVCSAGSLGEAEPAAEAAGARVLTVGAGAGPRPAPRARRTRRRGRADRRAGAALPGRSLRWSSTPPAPPAAPRAPRSPTSTW
ncbi:2-succinylbenzoate--CoA ligase [Streptomyces fumanus]